VLEVLADVVSAAIEFASTGNNTITLGDGAGDSVFIGNGSGGGCGEAATISQPRNRWRARRCHSQPRQGLGGTMADIAKNTTMVIAVQSAEH
jgi:hypothetical protein